jgi:hypothetical protein
MSLSDSPGIADLIFLLSSATFDTQYVFEWYSERLVSLVWVFRRYDELARRSISVWFVAIKIFNSCTKHLSKFQREHRKSDGGICFQILSDLNMKLGVFCVNSPETVHLCTKSFLNPHHVKHSAIESTTIVDDKFMRFSNLSDDQRYVWAFLWYASIKSKDELALLLTSDHLCDSPWNPSEGDRSIIPPQKLKFFTGGSSTLLGTVEECQIEGRRSDETYLSAIATQKPDSIIFGENLANLTLLKSHISQYRPCVGWSPFVALPIGLLNTDSCRIALCNIIKVSSLPNPPCQIRVALFGFSPMVIHNVNQELKKALDSVFKNTHF